MEQLEEQTIPIEDGRARHSKLDVQFSEPFVDIDVPDRLTIDGKTSECSGSEKAPDMLAVRARGG
jgi:hypothetical protein